MSRMCFLATAAALAAAAPALANPTSGVPAVVQMQQMTPAAVEDARRLLADQGYHADDGTVARFAVLAVRADGELDVAFQCAGQMTKGHYSSQLRRVVLQNGWVGVFGDGTLTVLCPSGNQNFLQTRMIRPAK
jgi:hypothetical protein